METIIRLKATRKPEEMDAVKDSRQDILFKRIYSMANLFCLESIPSSGPCSYGFINVQSSNEIRVFKILWKLYTLNTAALRIKT